MKYRHRVLTLLASLSFLTYLDRVCISGGRSPATANELHLGPQDWGLVTGAFAIAYAVFEIPSGYLGDRFGARAMITRIVLWWSAFTALIRGFVSKLWLPLVVRFCFGAGEAGAYPTASTSVYRWFPPAERGRAFGVVLLSSQLGGAVALLLIVPWQMRFGWRLSFYVFGGVGVLGRRHGGACTGTVRKRRRASPRRKSPRSGKRRSGRRGIFRGGLWPHHATSGRSVGAAWRLPVRLLFLSLLVAPPT